MIQHGNATIERMAGALVVIFNKTVLTKIVDVTGEHIVKKDDGYVGAISTNGTPITWKEKKDRRHDLLYETFCQNDRLITKQKIIPLEET